MYTPNFFLVGAPRCGTTALCQHLQEHVDVFVCEPKEPFFWADDYGGMKQAAGVGSLTQYEALFARAKTERVVGEGSTLYLVSDQAIKRILDYSPAAKFVVILRDPVEVAYSFYGQLKRTLNEDLASFEEAWEAQTERAAGMKIPSACIEPKQLQYKMIASLGTQVQRFFEIVPPHQRLVLWNEDMRREPARLIADLYKFLEISHDGRQEIRQVNAASAYRSRRLAFIMRSPIVRSLANTCKRALPLQLVRKIQALKSQSLTKSSERAELSSEFAANVRRELASEIELLGEVTGRDVSAWLETPGSAARAGSENG